MDRNEQKDKFAGMNFYINVCGDDSMFVQYNYTKMVDWL